MASVVSSPRSGFRRRCSLSLRSCWPAGSSFYVGQCLDASTECEMAAGRLTTDPSPPLLWLEPHRSGPRWPLGSPLPRSLRSNRVGRGSSRPRRSGAGLGLWHGRHSRSPVESGVRLGLGLVLPTPGRGRLHDQRSRPERTGAPSSGAAYGGQSCGREGRLQDRLPESARSTSARTGPTTSATSARRTAGSSRPTSPASNDGASP